MAQKVHIKKLLRTEDAFLSTSDRIYEYFLSHTRQIIISFVVILLLAGAVLLYLNAQNKAQIRASGALEKVLAEGGEKEVLIAALVQVRTDYPTAPAARQAGFHLVSLYADNGQLKQAASLLEELYKNSPQVEESLKTLYLSNLGALNEELQNYTEALLNYQTAYALSDREILSPWEDRSYQAEILSSVARVALKLDQVDVAIKALEDIGLKYPETFRAYSAQQKLAGLKARQEKNVPETAVDPEAQTEAEIIKDPAGEVNTGDTKTSGSE